MATTSTESAPNTNHQSYRLGHNIINRAREKIWNGDIVATASTHGFWEPDKEFKIKAKVNELKHKFHQNRYLQIKHLPRDVTEGEIRQMLSDFPISSVVLSCGHGSAGSAKAYLEDPEMLEDWDKERTFMLRGQKIPVSPTQTELVLCVARYPLHYDESRFATLVRSYGEIKMCFLMISEKTGESKGYGFVEYASKESALHAKSKLDGLVVENMKLCADFIDSAHMTFDSLHSKCLYVDNLPHNYRDMGEFRRKLSKVVNPPYCQIALQNGCPQNWGLVEFNTGDDAEATHAQLNGTLLKDKKLRISYYIPGVRAINLYLKLLNETDNRGKGNGLLPTPPPGVFQSFKNLQKQNPIFAQSIQNIMVTEQQLGSGNPGNITNNDDSTGKSGPRKKTGGKPVLSSSSGSEISIPEQDQQISLVRLLAAQAAHNLRNPQVLAFLKQSKGAVNGNVHPLLGGHEAAGLALPGGMPNMMPAIPIIPTLPGLGQPDFVSRVPPPPVSLLGVSPGVEQTSLLTSNSFPSPGGEKGSAIPRTTPGPTQLWNSAGLPVRDGEPSDDPSLSADENILGPHLPFAGAQLNPFAQRAGLGLTALIPGAHQLTRGMTNPALSLNPLLAAEFHSLAQATPNGLPPGWMHQQLLESPHFLLPPASGGLGPFMNQTALLQYISDNPQVQSLFNESLNQYLGGASSLASKQTGANVYKLSSDNSDDHVLSKRPLHHSPTLNSQLFRSSSNGSSSSSKLSDSQNSNESDLANVESPARVPAQPHPSALPMPIWSLPVPSRPPPSVPPPRPIGFEARWRNASGVQSTPPSNNWNANPFSSPPPNASNVTPVGQKRKYTRFLPSPEPSPEGSYIGQHSQGIGGHYPDSWSKRKKKN